MATTEPTTRDHYATSAEDIEKQVHHGGDGHDLQRMQSNVTLSQEMFERLYLNPNRSPEGGMLRKTLCNPTPLAIVGFLLALTPLSCVLMGWRGASNPVVQAGSFYYLGGMCMVIGGVFEGIIGNTFPFVVFISFGAFWLSYATLSTSFYGLQAAYSTTGNAAQGAETVGYNSGLAFYLLFWGVMCTIYAVISLRTNLVFFTIFVTVDMAFLLLAGTYWHTAAGNLATAAACTKAAGAFAFVCTLAGWYLLVVILLDSLDFPFSLPVGDLSNFIPARKRPTEKTA